MLQNDIFRYIWNDFRHWNWKCTKIICSDLVGTILSSGAGHGAKSCFQTYLGRCSALELSMLHFLLIPNMWLWSIFSIRAEVRFVGAFFRSRAENHFKYVRTISNLPESHCRVFLHSRWVSAPGAGPQLPPCSWPGTKMHQCKNTRRWDCGDGGRVNHNSVPQVRPHRHELWLIR